MTASFRCGEMSSRVTTFRSYTYVVWIGGSASGSLIRAYAMYSPIPPSNARMRGVSRTRSHHRRRRNDFRVGFSPAGFVPARPAGAVFLPEPPRADAAAFPAFPEVGGRLEVCFGVYRSRLGSDG